jgi:hypothetical protein
MKSPKKHKQKSDSAKQEKEHDQISETRERLEQQKKALQKIIEQFSKKQNDK